MPISILTICLSQELADTDRAKRPFPLATTCRTKDFTQIVSFFCEASLRSGRAKDSQNMSEEQQDASQNIIQNDRDGTKPIMGFPP